MATEWNPSQVWQRILHATRSAHDVIIYLTAYATATPSSPVRQTTPRTNQNRHFTSCKQQTLRCLSHNYARFDVPRRGGDGDGDEARDGVSLSAGILMGHLRRRSRKESETGALLALNIFILPAVAVNKSLLNRRSDEMFYVPMIREREVKV